MLRNLCRQTNKVLRSGISSIAVFAALTAGTPASAQSQPLSLDDLIPDAAVENPDDWAADQAVPPVQDTGDSTLEAVEAEDSSVDPAELAPDSPMAELPDLAVEWPDDLQIEPIQELEPDEDIQFAAPELPADLGMENSDLVEIGDELALAFPVDEAAFPIQDEFVDRFRALSTIRELSGDDGSIAQLAARARSDQQLLVDILRAYGYYDGQVIRTVGGLRAEGVASGDANDDASDDARARVRFDIVPGQLYRYASIDFGQLNQAPDYAELRAAFGIEVNDPVASDVIVEQQIDLDTALGETGYPFAVIDEPELVIDHREASGDLTVPVSPNGKYAFGGVTSTLPDFLSGKHIASIARFDEGDTYKRSLELDLRRAIAATGLISSVTITPVEVTPPTADGPGIVDLAVDMTKAPLRTITGAIGYGSEEGFRLQGSWEHRNLFPPEGSLKLRGILGTQEQLAGVTFRKNNFGGRDKVLTLDAYASTIDSDAFDARTVAFVASYERTSTLLFQKPLSWSGGLEILASSERPAAVDGVTQPRQTFFVAALPLTALIDTSDSLLNPTEGFRLGGRLSPEVSRTQGVESFYLRAQVDASYYQSITDNVIAAGRVRFGSIPGTDLENIAPSRRYYAGGGGSVRGYGFQQIGPRDVEGEPTGGLSVVELAAEARIRTGFFDGALWVVPFVDAGSVSRGTTPDLDQIRIGAGLGIRYDTGFGPIRVDVGVPLNPGPDDNPVAVYVSLGQAF